MTIDHWGWGHELSLQLFERSCTSKSVGHFLKQTAEHDCHFLDSS